MYQKEHVAWTSDMLFQELVVDKARFCFLRQIKTNHFNTQTLAQAMLRPVRAFVNSAMHSGNANNVSLGLASTLCNIKNKAFLEGSATSYSRDFRNKAKTQFLIPRVQQNVH